MKWTLLAASAAIAVTLSLPAQAAPATVQPAATAPDETITFEQYRDFRLHDIARRQVRLADRLGAGDLSPELKIRLEEQKSYYDWLAGLPEDERDRRFHARFDLIDTNHDGKIDAAERAAWRDRQRERYRHQAAADYSAQHP